MVRELARYGPTRSMARIRAEPEVSKDKLMDISNPHGGPWQCIRLKETSGNSQGKVSDKSTDYEFERVFGPGESNADVFDAIKNFSSMALQCASVTIVGYGQTGSGKTHTFFGSQADPGIVQRQIQDCLESSALCDDGYDSELSISAVEFYLGHLQMRKKPRVFWTALFKNARLLQHAET
ncbi:P-loop containing nucleoside triphosphate hydrolase protein [Xylariaceae sp. FL1019]|nr:P-loop containing nucleoside triphosphate hydrolase protein [Xylariaceae sp. FL1019]